VDIRSAVLTSVSRASERSRAVAREELKDGIYDLATIASIAPWIGLLGTTLTLTALPGYDGPIGGLWRLAFTHRARSMGYTAFGLLVGLIAFWLYQYLSNRLSTLDREMENASLDLLNQLSRLPGRFTINPALDGPSLGKMFGELPAGDIAREESFFHRSLFISPAFLALAWLAEAVRLSAFDACLFTPLLLAASCVFVYPFWSRFLHRRPGAMLSLASALCLCWSLAEFAFGTSLP
jgi:hypothetical protein